MPAIVLLKVIHGLVGQFEVHCEDRPGPPTQHESIEAALRFYGDEIPLNYCRFVDVVYKGVSLGTTSVKDLARNPDVHARKLVATYAAVLQAQESVERSKSNSRLAAA